MLKGHWAVMMALVLTPWMSARAQQFPGDEDYLPWPCYSGPTIVAMTDPRLDEPGAIDERDLVGDVGAPAGLRAADPDFLYVRLRVDEDPAPGGTPRPFAWGLLFDVDGDLSAYDVMLLADGGADGGAGAVSILRNTSGTPGDLRDPPDSPAASSYGWDLRARSVTAPGSTYGDTPDYFIDLAFSWSDLAAVGVAPSTPVRVWAATSSTASAGMDGDFACRSGGAPGAGGTWPRTVADPGPDSDGDGFSDATEVQSDTDPNDPASRPTGEPKLAGGGGCHHGAAGIPALGVLLALLRTRRRASET